MHGLYVIVFEHTAIFAYSCITGSPDQLQSPVKLIRTAYQLRLHSALARVPLLKRIKVAQVPETTVFASDKTF